MPRRPASVLVAATLLLLAPLGAPALAAPGDDTAPRSPERLADGDCARARARHRTCVLTMDAEAVAGGAARAEGSAVTARTHAPFTSLIRVRADFRAEILRAAEDVP
jgi:hypothetical protein